MVSRWITLVAVASLVAYAPARALGIDCTRVDDEDFLAEAWAVATAYSFDPAWEDDVTAGPFEDYDFDEQIAVADAAADAATPISGTSAHAQAQSTAECNVGWQGVSDVPTVEAMVQLRAVASLWGAATAQGDAICYTLFEPESGSEVSGSLYLVATGTVDLSGEYSWATITAALFASCNSSGVIAEGGPDFSITGVVGGTTIGYVSMGGMNELFNFVEEPVGNEIPLQAAVQPYPYAPAVADVYAYDGDAESTWDFVASAWFEMLP